MGPIHTKVHAYGVYLTGVHLIDVHLTGVRLLQAYILEPCIIYLSRVIPVLCAPRFGLLGHFEAAGDLCVGKYT